jgi:hypothetical protein
VVANLFKRLHAERPGEGPTAQPTKQRREDVKIFLKDILANGPMAATLAEERGAERGFTRIQLRYARYRMKIISFKGHGPRGRWYWVLPYDSRGLPAQLRVPRQPLRLGV